MNALIGAASDPEAAVRASAVASLGSIGDRQRSLVPIVARLGDEARVVRVKAAEVLVGFGIIELPGPAGEALKKAQDEYIVSLDTFPTWRRITPQRAGSSPSAATPSSRETP